MDSLLQGLAQDIDPLDALDSDVAWLPDDPCAWIEREFYIPELNAPMQLHASQRIPLEEALRRDADDNFVYSTVLWGAIKKSAKSSIAAAVGMWFAWRRPGASIKVLGNDLDQAQSRVFEYMRRAVLLNPQWRSSISLTQTKITLPNGSVIKAVPVDPAGEAGGGDDLLLYTELWGWKSKKHQQMWSESTLSPLLYGKSLRWCESYAGYDNDSPVLEQLYDTSVKQGIVLNADLEMYAQPSARLFALWNTKPLLPWQTDEYYAQERASLTPSEFDRLHRNQWGSSTSAFVPIEWWEQCKVDVMPPLRGSENPGKPMQPMIIALDAAVSNDCFGIVAITRTGGRIEVRNVRKWQPHNGERLPYTDPFGDKYNTEYPEGYLRWLIKIYHVSAVTYDIYQLHDFCTRLSNERIAHFEPFNQGADRLIADKQLYDLIKDGQIIHDGNDDLHEHMRNADRTDDDADKLRIVKRASGKKIDLVVCLSMGAAIAKKWNIG